MSGWATATIRFRPSSSKAVLRQAVAASVARPRAPVAAAEAVAELDLGAAELERLQAAIAHDRARRLLPRDPEAEAVLGLNRHMPLDDCARLLARGRERPPKVRPLLGVDRVDLGDVVRG